MMQQRVLSAFAYEMLSAWVVASATLVGCGASSVTARAEGTNAAAPPAAATPWPTLERISGPPSAEQYVQRAPVLLWQRQGERVEVASARSRRPHVDPLPFEPPAELQVQGSSKRFVVEQPGGWLVALDQGEFGDGLYWVEAATRNVERLDLNLVAPIRWVGALGPKAFAVAGLCHGIGCTHQTTVFELMRFDERGWRLLPRAVFDGCPGAISVGADGRSVVIAAGCGGLHAIDDEGQYRALATWPEHLHPIQVIAVREAGLDEGAYYVSFGRTLACFRGGTAEWFAPLPEGSVMRGFGVAGASR